MSFAQCFPPPATRPTLIRYLLLKCLPFTRDYDPHVRTLEPVSLYYPILSLVSKRFHSLLTPSELYQTRSLLGCTENCLYVCLRFERIPHRFMLGRRPNRSDTREKNKSSGYVLVTIPIPHSPSAYQSDLVAVGYNIYNIGGSMYDSPSSSVSILDCRSHTWLEAPSMQVELKYPSASFLDGKIYVTGGCNKQYNPSNWMEVFDIKNKTWEPMLCPTGTYRLSLDRCHHQTNSVVVDGKLYIIGGKSVVYNPKDGIRWSRLGPEMDFLLNWFSSCVIENVLYYYYQEGIKWYDTKVRSWRTLNGMKKLPKFAHHVKVMLADYGGKIALFWNKFVGSGGGGGGYQNKMIWCAMIEIWGTVEWCDAVLPHPIHVEYVFEHLVVVNL